MFRISIAIAFFGCVVGLGPAEFKLSPSGQVIVKIPGKFWLAAYESYET